MGCGSSVAVPSDLKPPAANSDPTSVKSENGIDSASSATNADPVKSIQPPPTSQDTSSTNNQFNGSASSISSNPSSLPSPSGSSGNSSSLTSSAAPIISQRKPLAIAPIRHTLTLDRFTCASRAVWLFALHVALPSEHLSIAFEELPALDDQSINKPPPNARQVSFGSPLNRTLRAQQAPQSERQRADAWMSKIQNASMNHTTPRLESTAMKSCVREPSAIIKYLCVRFELVGWPPIPDSLPFSVEMMLSTTSSEPAQSKGKLSIDVNAESDFPPLRSPLSTKSTASATSPTRRLPPISPTSTQSLMSEFIPASQKTLTATSAQFVFDRMMVNVMLPLAAIVERQLQCPSVADPTVALYTSLRHALKQTYELINQLHALAAIRAQPTHNRLDALDVWFIALVPILDRLAFDWTCTPSAVQRWHKHVCSSSFCLASARLSAEATLVSQPKLLPASAFSTAYSAITAGSKVYYSPHASENPTPISFQAMLYQPKPKLWLHCSERGNAPSSIALRLFVAMFKVPLTLDILSDDAKVKRIAAAKRIPYFPALFDDSSSCTVTEAPAIMRYLCRRFNMFHVLPKECSAMSSVEQIVGCLTSRVYPAAQSYLVAVNTAVGVAHARTQLNAVLDAIARESWSQRLIHADDTDRDLFQQMWIPRLLLGAALVSVELGGYSVRATGAMVLVHFLAAFHALLTRYHIALI